MEQRTDPAQVEHPPWCLKGRICRVDGIHHSKPLPATSGDAHDAIRVWLEQAWKLPHPSVVLESTIDGEVGYVYLPVSQARVLRHQLGRLLNLAKQPPSVAPTQTTGERPAEPGEVCTCGRPAVKVFTGGRFGDTGYCGRPDGGQPGPCPFCGGERHVGERCPRYQLRPGGAR